MNARTIRMTIVPSGTAIMTGVAAAFVFALSPQNTAALSLPNVGTIELPVAGTVLEHVVTPVTDTTNRLLPIDVTPTPDTLGVSVTLPTEQPAASPNPHALSVSLPLPVVSQAVTAVTNLPAQMESYRQQSPLQAPDQLNEPLPAVSEDEQTKPETVTASMISTKNVPVAKAEASDPPSPLSAPPMIFGITNFFGRGFPNDLQTIATSITKNPQSLLPLAVSTGIFLMMLITVMGIVFIMDRAGGRIMSSGGRLGEFAQTHDLTQLAAAGIVVLGSIIVICFLALTYL